MHYDSVNRQHLRGVSDPRLSSDSDRRPEPRVYSSGKDAVMNGREYLTIFSKRELQLLSGSVHMQDQEPRRPTTAFPISRSVEQPCKADCTLG